MLYEMWIQEIHGLKEISGYDEVFSPTLISSGEKGSKHSVHYTGITEVRGLFLESPETFRAHFVWHNSLCIFKTKASRGTKLCSYFYFYSLCNIWKDQLHRICRSEFYEWLFGPEKFSGLSRNGPLDAYMAFLHEWCAKKWHYDETGSHNAETTPRNGETTSHNDKTTSHNGETTSHNDKTT